MKKNQTSLGRVRRENFMLAAGFCVGLSCKREPIVLSQHDRRVLRIASKALVAASKELWPDWFK